jgi:hypothetical protein
MTKLLVAWAGGVTTLQHLLVTVITITPHNRVLLEKLIGQAPSLVKKFPTFYGI